MSYLDDIIAWHRKRAQSDPRDPKMLRSLLEGNRGNHATRGFREALSRGGELHVIAEVKRKSPSKGVIDATLDPASLAREYEAAGAACLSVLTDGPHFGGSETDLRTARQATQLPVLRKDFTVCELDVIDAALMGADAVLLIASALSDRELRQLHDVSRALMINCLVEVHDEEELSRAAAIGADLIGVNQRDLRTFSVDQARAESLAALMPSNVIAVAESGIRGVDDARTLANAGYRAILVGEHLVRSTRREEALRELRVALPS
ncbi:MAG: indole-3-glycerol phosphate synthase TrpC [Actinomycetota bacterium]